MSVRRSLLAAVPWTAALIPPVLVGRVMVRDAVNVPFMDQWYFAGSVAEGARGIVRTAGLWEANNEHRVLLPRLIMLGLARLTRWDVRWEMGLSFVLALGTLALLAALIRHAVRPISRSLVPWLALVASFETFSLAQWQNWTWGWQMTVYLNVCAATASWWALARWGATWRGLSFVLLAAVAAVTSFGTGLGLLALVPLGVLWAGGRAARAQAGVSALVCGALAAAYFVDFRPVGNPTPQGGIDVHHSRRVRP